MNAALKWQKSCIQNAEKCSKILRKVPQMQLQSRGILKISILSAVSHTLLLQKSCTHPLYCPQVRLEF